MTNRLPALFLGHGSPMTVISDVPERRAWQALAKVLPRPEAILVVSAHWQTQGAIHLTAGAHPRTIHDFGGFPQEMYDMRYPAPGNDALVERVIGLIGADKAQADSSWGFDHGSWCVMQPMYPEADIPMIQLSLNRSLSPDEHFAAAERIAVLRDEGVLLVASGNVVHNLSLYGRFAGQRPDWAVDFQSRITAAMQTGNRSALVTFDPQDQAAAAAINSAEHYLPLLYAEGWRLHGDEVGVFNDTVESSLSMTSYLLGNAGLLKAIS